MFWFGMCMTAWAVLFAVALTCLETTNVKETLSAVRIENMALKIANKQCRDQFDALIIAIGK